MRRAAYLRIGSISTFRWARLVFQRVCRPPRARSQTGSRVATTSALLAIEARARRGVRHTTIASSCTHSTSPSRYRRGASKDELLQAMQGHVLGQTELVGTYQRRGLW
jgi:hypothetical protein